MNSVATTSSTTVRVGKRKNGSFSEELESPTKKLCTVSNNWYFVLASESEIDTDEGTESICSLQNKSTDWAKDTSDTSSKSGWSSDPGFEYEVASLSDNEHPNPFTQFSQDSYSSGTDTELLCSVTLTLDNDNDNDDSWADSSSISSDMDDPELSRADFWTCVKCKAQNNNPMFRYCEKCFKVRKNFFPPRPHRKNKKPRQNRLRKRKSNSSDSTGGMSKVRKQDNMSDVTSGRTSTDRVSPSEVSHGKLEHSCLEKDMFPEILPGAHSEFDSLSSSQETVVICNKSLSSSQETVIECTKSASSSQETRVPCGDLEEDKKTGEEHVQKTWRTAIEETITLSRAELTESGHCSVDEKKLEKSSLESSEKVSSSEVGNTSAETTVSGRSESGSCESNATDQGNEHLSEVENLCEENKGAAEKSGGESSLNSENLLSRETVSKLCCESSSEVCTSNVEIEIDSQKNICDETLSQETAVLSQESVTLSQEPSTSGIETTSFASSDQGVSENSICSICMVNPKNGIFVHGKWAHIYCCYKCSMKVWMETGRCPICNAKVRQVLKAVVV